MLQEENDHDENKQKIIGMKELFGFAKVGENLIGATNGRMDVRPNN